jgi:hypothetical protein
MKCNKTQSKWCINKHGASKIIDTFETYQRWGFQRDGTHVRADARATTRGTGRSQSDGGTPQSEEAEAAPRPIRVSAVGWWNPRTGGWGLIRLKRIYNF